MKIMSDKLKKLLLEILQRSGSDEYEAEIVAEHLIQANLRGHDSHGAMIISYYMDWVKSGGLKPDTPAIKIKDAGPFLSLDGRRGYGQRAAKEAVAAAIKLCKEIGVAIVTLSNSGHIGRLGTYGEQAASEGFISINFANAYDYPLVVAPTGGKKALFKTNPICFAMPGAAENELIVMDYATSSMAYGKAEVFMNKGLPVPPNSIIDHEGRPTTDPRVLFEEPYGFLLPFGGHKGYGLLLFCELLAGCLSGGGPVNTYSEDTIGAINNLFAILIDPSRTIEQTRLREFVNGLVSYTRGCPPVEPDQPVLIPGDMERATMAKREKEGIPIDDESWAGIMRACTMVGITQEKIEQILH